ncbi:alpha/beta hydrolase [Arthrobacter sp. MYb227]|uniref:alpha/beta hydrolase family protein n=1 Tax=Arthrobacter sp. MYb227 TaxID=1848601 RepID=UPI000CFD85B5|nr:alpha/beta hydrolase [Arthrobacter sp. MYb227]PQZ90237.1 alpha/beta hydrolase [Arthrobacter sp. MYb227]
MESIYNPTRFPYGEHPSQFADLWVPDEITHKPVVIIIHGGFWRQKYGAELGIPLAQDLYTRGYVVWNLEYRRTCGGDGGWPQTFLDVAAGIDVLHTALDSMGIANAPRVAIGHSAGGHLALWAAGRHRLPDLAPGALPPGEQCLDAVISQAGILDLGLADTLGLSNGAARSLMGCDKQEAPELWDWADPAPRIPLGIPVVMLHGSTDEDVPVELGREFARRAMLVDAGVDYIEFDGDHYGLITVGDPAWNLCIQALQKLETTMLVGE